MSDSARPMTTAEKYYTFLDETWPTNLTVVADLDRVFPPELVESTWREFSAERVLTRAMPTPELTIVDGGTARIDFEADEVTADGLDEAVARESMTRHGTEKVAHCRVWTVPELERSRIALVAHHAIADGRSVLAELQQFLRFLGGGTLHPQRRLSRPQPSGRDPYPWQEDRKELLSLLREMSDRNRALGAPEPAWWPRATTERRPRFGCFVQPAGTAQHLAEAAAREGARVFPTIAAAAMASVARTVVGGEGRTLQLNVAVDLVGDRAHADVPPAVNVGVVSQRQRVHSAAPWPLAREITAALRTSLKRGEAELFFHLSRVDKAPDIAAGTALVATAIEAAAPAASVTHIGTVDSTDDPDWVTSLQVNQAPTPNQVLQTLSLEYRGRLVHSVTTDDLRVPARLADSLLEDFRDTLGGLQGRG